MPAEPGAPRRSSAAIIVLAAIAGVLYLLMLAGGADTQHRASLDAGIGAFFAFVLLWILLAAMLILGRVRGAMPGWAAIAAVLLHPLSAAGVIAAFFMVDETRSGAAALVLVALPLLLAGYALWAHFPTTHAAMPPHPTSAVVLGLAAALSIGQIYSMARNIWPSAAETAERQRQMDAAFERERQQEQQALVARYRRLNDESPLAEWKEFIGLGNELGTEARERARRLPHRQTDAEALLKGGDGFPLHYLDDLDLDATPELCAAAGDLMAKDAVEHRPASSHQGNWQSTDDLAGYLPAILWLVRNGCDLDAAIAAIEETARTYPEDAERDKLLGALVPLSGERRWCFVASSAPADRRIAGCTAVIASHPASAWTLAAAFANRGNAYDDNGESDRAIADYGQAILENPNLAIAFNNRGGIFARTGNRERAMQDFDAAIRLDPKFDLAFRSRGRAKFFAGDFSGATADFGEALRLAPGNSYTVLWLYLARARSGRAAGDELRRDAAPLDRTGWPWPLIAGYLGEQDSAAVEAGAARGDAARLRDQGCEAAFFLGEKAVLDNDPASARELLQKAAKTCRPGSIEFTSARFELARL